MTHTGSVVDRTGEWFLCSGIQKQDGGVARYYLSDKGCTAPTSTEITGYTAGALSYLYTLTSEKAYLDAALRAARFLARTAWNPALELFPFELSGDARSGSPPAYFFDSGIIVRGLLAAWRLTGDSELLDVAHAAGRGMRAFAEPEGLFHPVLALPAKDAVEYGTRWSGQPGCYQLKSAMAWHDLYLVTGEDEFRRWYESALAASLRSYRDFLPGAEQDAQVMDRLHAFCYFLEGMLPRAKSAGCTSALADGIARTAGYLRRIAPEFERSDVYAQLLRVRLLADAAGAVPLDAGAAAEEAAKAAGFQLEDDDRRIRHGFCFGRKSGRFLPFVNPVSSAFCLQALEMWRQHQAGRLGPDYQWLI